VPVIEDCGLASAAMDAQVALVTHIWRFLSIRDLCALMQVSTFARDQLCRNQNVIGRITRFLQNGIRVLQYYTHQTQIQNQELDAQATKWRRTIERVSRSQPVFLFRV
jgi:hypothetical protein